MVPPDIRKRKVRTDPNSGGMAIKCCGSLNIGKGDTMGTEWLLCLPLALMVAPVTDAVLHVANWAIRGRSG
jgi:hypothetical protein